MNIGLALLLVVVFLASAASLLGGAVVYYGTTEGVVNGLDTSSVGIPQRDTGGYSVDRPEQA